MKKFETINVEILGKKYNTIKPSAMQVIKLEDECLTKNGIDLPKMIEGYLKFVDKNLSLETFDEKEVKDLVIELEEEKIIVKEFNTRKKLVVSSIISNGKIDRIAVVEKILQLSGSKLVLSELSYSNLNYIFEKAYENIDIEEVVSAQEQIATFLQA